MDKSSSHINEKFIQEIWKNQMFDKELTTRDGQTITIIETGNENKELGGPDFRNCRIKIGNITYTGDIEIDTYYNDWKQHGHHLNKKYNRIILHLTLIGDNAHPFVFTEEGRKVQSVPLSQFFGENIRNVLQEAILTERKSRQSKMTCIDVNNIVNEKEKLDFLLQLGMERFKSKCDKVFIRLKELVYERELKAMEPVINYEPDSSFHERKFTSRDFSDHELWEQIIYEYIFEALGYSKNKSQMLKLAKTVDLALLKKYRSREDFTLYLEAAYFHAAGLLPEGFTFQDAETSAYMRKIRELWNEMQSGFDGQIMNASTWHFHKLRPQNFPTLRIAGGVRIVQRIINDNLIGRIIGDFKQIYDLKNLGATLRNLLITHGEGYWREYYTIDEKTSSPVNYFIGVSRVDELMINVILPIFSVYFEIFHRLEAAKKVQRLYLNYIQISDNSLVTDVAEGLNLHDAWKRSVLYQGMIELFRTYCSKEKCLECKIGKAAFS